MRGYALAQPRRPPSADKQAVFVHHGQWPRQFLVHRTDPCASQATAEDDHLSAYTASMPCRILKLLVPSDSKVKAGDALMTVESMKMESRVYSKHEGQVKFRVAEGQVVEAGTLMLDVVVDAK